MAPEKPQPEVHPEKFPWDFDNPNTPFWNDTALAPPLPRNFLTCFTAGEIKEMDLDASAHLNKQDKLSLLLHRIHTKYKTREAEQEPPLPLYDAAWEDWQRLMTGIINLQDLSGLKEEQEKSLEVLIQHGRDGKRNLSGVNMMASFKMEQGEYGDAETMLREVLPWLQGHEMLGKDSPQALGCIRRLIECLWKGGKLVEAERLLDEYRSLVETMGDGKFGKYREEEQKEVEKLEREHRE